MTPVPAKFRSAFLIDGFNLYHAIDCAPHFHGFKWLDPVALARAFIMPSKEAITGIFFFTALPPWDEVKRARHQRLLDIYHDVGVITKPGIFLPTEATCRICGKTYSTYREKLTDINICIEMLRLGADDLVDRIYLVTGDNDQAASVRRFRELHPEKQVIAIIPPFRSAAELQSSATSSRTINQGQLSRSVLPDPFPFRDGKRVYAKPITWVAKPMPEGWRANCSHD